VKNSPPFQRPIPKDGARSRLSWDDIQMDIHSIVFCVLKISERIRSPPGFRFANSIRSASGATNLDLPLSPATPVLVVEPVGSRTANQT